ncbi:murein L,D-transpeptidase catalytic domain family protein [Hymenobacter caeli]|uniref:Murein L,D-transpeptidase catalytic domain family protein n=1 Tax=Hymenobacter caeli TaxID=2735894 RepID=A0ABX2FMK8_9BACT|nr:murein L,D-transpeptidase catalytic domain family protein [Hymenobacter caeli]NRT18172.1 hypothetical protein [Hymenobacter caeli]
MDKHQISVVQRQRGQRRTKRAFRRALPFVAALFLATPIAAPVSQSLAGSAHFAPPRAAAAPTKALLFNAKLHESYDALGPGAQGLRFDVFEKAMTGYLNLKQTNRLATDKQLLTVVDFDLPSTEKRLWVVDLASHQVLFHTLVAHGHNSGENQATAFSNTDASNMSSLGFYVTGREYQGKHGHSLRLAGLDEGFNTNAAARAVVMHGADYVSEEFIKANGRLGRSLGCPALPMDQYAQIIAAVNGGTCLFIHKSDAGYSSKFLDQHVAVQALTTAGPSAS